MREETQSGIPFPYSFDKRIDELEDNFESSEVFQKSLSAFISEMEFRYQPKQSPYNRGNFWHSTKDSFYQIKNQVKGQPGLSLSVFFLLEDLWLNIFETNKHFPKLTLKEFLNFEEHLLIPMKLKRPGETFLDEVKSPKFISCIYVLDHQQNIIVSAFTEKEIHKIWFNRIKHSYLASFNNVFAAGVMYFCPNTKELLFVNNASGHYRIKDADSCKMLIEPLRNLNISISNCKFSHYNDVEFLQSQKLINK